MSEGTTGRPDVAARITALETALRAGGPRLDPGAVQQARVTLERTGDRLRLGAENTVVALVGATGSGKSSLFNALAGMEISEVGVRRPTTNSPMACVWSADGGGTLLDWLEIPPRNRTVRESVLDADRQAPLHGLVLIDLPDHDSADVSHRREVDRLVRLVDLLVWVVDPQKYADDALHAGYLKRLTGHDAVMIVVLNQVDRLGDGEADTCRKDLRRLLDGDGLEAVGLLTTSARRGEGVEELHSVLAGVVQRQAAVARRAAADLDSVAAELTHSMAAGDPAADGSLPGTDELVAALSAAAGVPIVLDAVEADYRRRASAEVGWPITRLIRRLGPDPLRRLKLAPAAEADVRRLTRPSLPASTPAQRSQVDLAVRALTAATAEQLPPRWGEAVRAAADPPGDDLADTLDAAITDVDLDLRRPAWWQLVQVAHVLLALAAVVGFVWLAVIGVEDWVGMTAPTPPAIGGFPLPTLLLAGGVIGGLLLAALSGTLVRAGARHRRAQVAAQLTQVVGEVAERRVLLPVTAVLDDHRTAREALVGTA